MNDTIRQKRAKLVVVHRVAVLLLPPVVGFDATIPPTLFGAAVDDDGNPLYDVVTCGADPGTRRVDERVRHRRRSRTRGAGARRHRHRPRHPLRRRRGSTACCPRTPRRRWRRSGPAPGWCRSAPARSCSPRRACSTGGRRPRTGSSPTTLRRLHPAVRVDEKVLFVDDGDVLTSAGLAAGIDLCLHIIRADHGAQVANAVARYCVVPPWREGGQAQFIDRHAARRRTTRRPAATREWALRHLDEALTVERSGPARRDEPADLQPPVPRGDRARRRARGSGTAASTARASCSSRATCPSTRWPGSPVSAPAATCATICVAAWACRRRAIARSIKARDRAARSTMTPMPEPLIMPIKGRTPQLHAESWVAPNASRDRSGQARRAGQRLVLRDPARRVRAHRDRRSAPTFRTASPSTSTPGSRPPSEPAVSVGHNAVLHGCTVEDDCLIGMGAIVLNGARHRARVAGRRRCGGRPGHDRPAGVVGRRRAGPGPARTQRRRGDQQPAQRRRSTST